MIIESISQLPSTTEDRVVVIGSGAVGTHLAVQLARRGRDVVLLESGNQILGNFPSNSFRSVGHKHDGIRLGRSVALGGTSNLWGGQLVEFESLDFEDRDWVANSGWPVDYQELSKYYAPTYEAFDYAGDSQQDAVVWESIGRTAPKFDGTIDVFLTRWLKRPNMAEHYSKDIDTNPHLTVVMNTTVVGFAGAGDRIQKVKVVDAKGKPHELAGSQFVLAAGTIENSRLLLHAANDQSWQCPWRENDNVGRYFHDHLGGRIARISPKDHREFFKDFSTIAYSGSKFLPKIRVKQSVVRDNQILGCQAMLSFEHSVKEHLVFLKQFVKAALGSKKIGSIPKFFKHMFASLRHLPPLMWMYIVEHRLMVPKGSEINLGVQAEVEPLYESRITIDPEKTDHFGLPAVVLDWQLSGKEVESIARFAEIVKAAFEKEGVATVEIRPQLAERKMEFLDSLHDTNHQGGGCIMGTSAENGVVDRNLQVFGCPNLYALGACIFPTASHANCTFTAMTFGTRLADHLAEGQHAND